LTFKIPNDRAGVIFATVKSPRTIWHDLRRNRCNQTARAHGVHEYDIQDLLGHSKPGVTTVYARAHTPALEAAVKKLIEPIDQVVEFERKAG
jgi:integrase